MAIHGLKPLVSPHHLLRFGTYSGGTDPEADEALFEKDPQAFKQAVDTWAKEQAQRAHEEGIQLIKDTIKREEEIRRRNERN